MTWYTQQFENYNYMNRGMVGKLPVKKMSHWRNIDTQYWTNNCGLELHHNWGYGWRRSGLEKCNIEVGMVRLQHALVAAGKCKGGNMLLAGELTREYYKKRQQIDHYRCPYHEDLLENWGKYSCFNWYFACYTFFIFTHILPITSTEAFVEELKSYEDGIERFSISNVMLPTSPFFSTSVMPIINENITKITSLELVDCNLKTGTDVDLISKFVKMNKLLGVLNLSQNELFGIDDQRNFNAGAKLLSKAMKKHPGLLHVNLSHTGLQGFKCQEGINNEALELILDGCKGINSLIIDSHTFGKKGLALVTDFLVKKNAVSEFSLGGGSIGEEDDRKPNAKALKQCLEKNTTLEQLCLSSNNLGSDDRIFSTIMSGIKGSVSLTYVDLSDNSIRNMPSVKLIAKYLARNPSLIGLDLSNNDMPSRSANVLIESLKKNTNLQHLSLRCNNITDQSVPPIKDLLQINTTLSSIDLDYNNIHVKKGRMELLKALCDPTSLDSIMNSNHTCSLIIVGRNYGGTHEVELGNINALENEGKKIRYKIVLALREMNKELYDPKMFDDIPLEIMHKVLELVQLEIGCNDYGKGIVKSVKKRNTINRLSNIYETIHQWPDFPSLFSRGPGKGSITKKGKLKRKFDDIKRVPKLADEDEDFVPNGFRKTRRKRWQRTEEGLRYIAEPAPAPSRSSSRSTAAISYADVENSDDES